VHGPDLFRSDLLRGRTVVAAGAVASACRALGASVAALDADPLDETAVTEAVARLADEHGGLDAVVDDAAARFAATVTGGDADPLAPLRAAADGAWLVARAAATQAMIDAPQGGKLIFLAPAPDAGPHAGATRAALENLARTLSVEWARHGVRPTALAPGRAGDPQQLAALAAFLVSAAGDYYSGCVFSLR